ncbi:MAG: flagellar filament capping protein FliD [Pseudomonadota bacterium]
MVSPLNTANALAGLNPNGVSASDVYGRVSKSLLAQNASVQKLTGSISRDQTRLSGLGQLQSALANFQAFAQSLSGVGLQTAANASKPSVLTALTNGNAKPGSYKVEVRQLAQAQTLLSRPQNSADTAIGGAAATTIKVDFGSTAGSSFSAHASKTFTIDASNNSLQGIAAAFSQAGIESKVVRSGNAYALQLTAQTGSANSLRISVGGDSALQNLLAFDPAGSHRLNQTSAAQDAVLSIDGKQLTRDSNVITGEIGGTALALTATGDTDVVVAQDSGAIARNVANFAQGYNNLSTRLAALKQGELQSDATLGQLQNQLSELVQRGGALAKVGVTLDHNGQLKVDSKLLKDAIAADAGAVGKLFTDNGKGVADQLAARIGQLVGAGGSIGQRSAATQKEIASLGSQKTRLTDTLSAQASALAAQYSQASQSSTGNSVLPGYTGPTSLFDFLA